MRASGWRMLVLGSLIILSAVAGCKGDLSQPSTSAPAGGPLAGRTIPVKIVTVDGSHPRPVVQVSVAGGPPVPVLLDTGSTGLRIFMADAGKSGLVATDKSETAQFGDGTLFNGVQAKAPAVIGGMPTAGPIALQLVTRVGCSPNVDHCPGQSGIQGYRRDQQIDGIIGIGLNSAPIFNPLLQLAGGIPATYTVALHGSPGVISFGRPPPKALAALPMAQSGDPQQANGAPAWNDQTIPGCWAFGVPQQSQCINTTFDTGSVLTTATTSVPGAPPPPEAPAGLSFSLATTAGGQPVWRITTGTTAGRNQVSVVNSSAGPMVVAGIAIFRTLAVTYDLTDGKVIFGR